MSFPLQAMPTIHNGLDALWHHHYQKAEQVFQTLGEQGNAHAMYWLGNTYQLEGGMKRLDAGRILLRAAEMSDPWAMYRLYTKNPYSLCTVWPCSSKWDSKAVAIWERQSNGGNGKATFALALRKARTFWYNVTKWLPGMGQEKLNKMALKAFHQGYLGASYYIANHSTPHDFKYIIQAASAGFIPAYRVLTVHYKKTNNIQLAEKYQKKALQSGETDFISLLFHAHMQGALGYSKNPEKAYYYGKISSFYGEDVSGFFRADKSSKEFSLSTKVAKDKQIVLTQKAKEFVRTHPPYHYYDEFSFPIYAMRF
ncbi:SEL1-like repeat protein [Celerinatantimonas diazotrophica]|nr:sel1 repeat family protein [Celerinatantimonas diazotrophica]